MEMKYQNIELEKRHRRNSFQVMNIKEKVGRETQTWKEGETKIKDFLQEKLWLKNEEITVERAHTIGMKEDWRKMIINAKFLNCKQHEKVRYKCKNWYYWKIKSVSTKTSVGMLSRKEKKQSKDMPSLPKLPITVSSCTNSSSFFFICHFNNPWLCPQRGKVWRCAF